MSTSTSINHFSFRQEIAVQGFSRFSLTPSFPKVEMCWWYIKYNYNYCSSCWQKCNDETLLPSSFSSFNFSLDDKTYKMMYIKRKNLLSYRFPFVFLVSQGSQEDKSKTQMLDQLLGSTLDICDMDVWDQDLQTLIYQVRGKHWHLFV